MSSSRGLLNLIFFVFFLSVYIVIESSPSLFKSIEIERYDADVTLNAQGDMTITESWEMMYHETMRVRFRDIKYVKYPEYYPFVYVSENRATLDPSSIQAKFYKDGVDKTFYTRIGLSSNSDLDELGEYVQCYDRTSECESIFMDTYLAGRLKGKVRFVYTYTIQGAVTKYSDTSELNWRLFEYAEANIKASTVTIRLPEHSLGSDDLYAWGHGLSKGSIEIVDHKTIVAEMTDIKKGEFPEFRILMPNQIFPNIRTQNIVIHPDMHFDALYQYEVNLANQTNRRILMAQVMLYGSFVLLVGMAYITYRVYLKHDKEYVPEFQGDYLRELPDRSTPAEVSYMYYWQLIKDEVFTATLLDLIRRGYVKIEDQPGSLTESNSDFKLKRVDQSESELLPHEKTLMFMIFDMVGHRTETSTKAIEKFASTYEKANTFQRKAKEFVSQAKRQSEKNHDFERLKRVKGEAGRLALIPSVYAAICLVMWLGFQIETWIPLILSIVMAIGYLIYVGQFKRRSKEGNERYAKWKAFRNFLLNFSNMEDYPIPSIIVWEHYLVYATVFGLADLVMKQLETKLPKEAFEDQKATYLRRGLYHRYGYYGYHRTFSRTFSNAKSQATQTIARHNQAQAGSGGRGGGFSGGSSFGGGGGGGRSR